MYAIMRIQNPGENRKVVAEMLSKYCENFSNVATFGRWVQRMLQEGIPDKYFHGSRLPLQDQWSKTPDFIKKRRKVKKIT